MLHLVIIALLFLLTAPILAEGIEGRSLDELRKVGSEHGEKLMSDYESYSAEQLDSLIKAQVKQADEYKSSRPTIDVKIPMEPSIDSKVMSPSELMKSYSTSPSKMKIEKGLYVFVTLSMPDAELKQVLRDAGKYNATVFIRGFYKGSFKETARRVSDLTKISDNAEFTIDPLKFRQYGIKEVPAFVMTTEESEHCFQEPCIAPKNIKARGSVTIEYFLERVAKEGGQDARDRADEILKSKGDQNVLPN